MLAWKTLPPALAVLGLIAWSGSGGDGVGATPGSTVRPLRLVFAPTPPVRLPNYRTSGGYPQVSSTKTNVKAVNAALRGAVVRDQRRYERYVRRRWVPKVPWVFRPGYRHFGEYTTLPKLRLISASSVVVSALIPVRRVVPGGTGGGTWLSLTLRVPGASRVEVSDLFREPPRGLLALARAARRKVLSANECVRASVREELRVGLDFSLRGFDPTPGNYRHFALTPTGLAIGFSQGQVGAPVCSQVDVTVPYPLLRPYLSSLGRRLIAGVRRPLR
jgi:hypothetical protein